MVDLLLALRPPEWLNDFPSVTDLHEVLALPRVRENTRLWFAEQGQLVAFAFVDSYDNLRFEVDRRTADSRVEREIVAWGCTCLRKTAAQKGKALTLDTSCRDDAQERIALLERQGFLRRETYSLFLERSLNDPFPEPTWPTGFYLRPVQGEQDVSEIVALHRQAFGTEYMTVEQRLNMMHLPEYDPELDLLAIAPDGRMAAYALFTLNQEENQRSGRKKGHADVAATHPDFQRLGLARALALAGMALLKQRGAELVSLGTSSENAAIQHMAASAGFHIQSTKLWFARECPPD